MKNMRKEFIPFVAHLHKCSMQQLGVGKAG